MRTRSTGLGGVLVSTPKRVSSRTGNSTTGAPVFVMRAKSASGVRGGGGVPVPLSQVRISLSRLVRAVVSSLRAVFSSPCAPRNVPCASETC